ncbi:MAG: hypothetical protein WAK20_05285 [Candidatus Acidiferrum sp.]
MISVGCQLGGNFSSQERELRKEEKEAAGILALAPNSRILYPFEQLSAFFFWAGQGDWGNALTPIQNGTLPLSDKPTIKVFDEQAA